MPRISIALFMLYQPHYQQTGEDSYNEQFPAIEQ